MQQHGSKYLPPNPTPPHHTYDTCGWVKRSNATFSEHDHVAYRINWNATCSKMKGNILLADSPDPGGGGQRSKLNFFRT